MSGQQTKIHIRFSLIFRFYPKIDTEHWRFHVRQKPKNFAKILGCQAKHANELFLYYFINIKSLNIDLQFVPF
jgi:hypothetical protein